MGLSKPVNPMICGCKSTKNDWDMQEKQISDLNFVENHKKITFVLLLKRINYRIVNE